MEAVEPSRESDCRLFGSSSSEGTSTDAARTDNVAGYFDPISILINFRLSDLPSQTEHLDEGLNLRGLLNLVPSSLVAHEFCHFVQTLGTSAGLWIFDANVGLANVQTMLAITQVQAHGDAVRPPLWPRALVASDEDSQHLVMKSGKPRPGSLWRRGTYGIPASNRYRPKLELRRLWFCHARNYQRYDGLAPPTPGPTRNIARADGHPPWVSSSRRGDGTSNRIRSRENGAVS